MDRIQALLGRLGRRRTQAPLPRPPEQAVTPPATGSPQPRWDKPIPTVEAGPGQAVPWVRRSPARPQAAPGEDTDADRAA